MKKSLILIFSPDTQDVSEAMESLATDGHDHENEASSSGTALSLIRAPFSPSRLVTGEPRPVHLDKAVQAMRAGLKFNNKYQGELNEFQITNASCKNWENVSVRVHQIHPDATLQEFFEKVQTGKAFSLHRCSPETKNGTAAADLVFMARASASAFIAECEKGIKIRGSLIRAGWNRNMVKPAAQDVLQQSRVLQFTGPQDHVSIAAIKSMLDGMLEYQVITSREWNAGMGLRTVEIAFASIHVQSRWARRIFIERFRPTGAETRFQVRWAPDPCDARVVGPVRRLDMNWRRL